MFLQNLFTKKTKEPSQLEIKPQKVMLLDIPDADEKGNDLTQVYGYLKIAGVTHEQAEGVDPQKIIPDLVPFEKLLLEPDPQNIYDKTAIKVLLSDGRQIGWLPKSASEVKEQIYWRKEEDVGFLAAVESVVQAEGKSKYQKGPWLCTIMIALYGVREPKLRPLSEFTPLEEEYFITIKDILHKKDKNAEVLRPSTTDEYFYIHMPGHEELLRFRKNVSKRYCLIPMAYDLLENYFHGTLKIAPAPEREQRYKISTSRIFIKTPTDLYEIADIIVRIYRENEEKYKEMKRERREKAISLREDWRLFK